MGRRETLAVLALTSLAAGSMAQGAVLYEEQFTGSTLPSQVTVQDGWWSTNVHVATTGLTYTNGSTLATAGGALSVGDGWYVGAVVQLSTTPTPTTYAYNYDGSNAPSTVYISFLTNPQDGNTGFGGPQGINWLNKSQAYSSAGIFSTGNYWNYTGTHDATTGTDLMVLKLDFNSATSTTATIWVNPDITGGVLPAPVAGNTITTTAGLQIASLTSGNNTGGAVQLDEIRVGTAVADVIPVPEPATLGLFGLAALATLRRRRA